VPPENAELTRVGPGTPAGEYLRRFWQPVALAAQIADLPKRVRVLGEDLVLFRDGTGQVGLLALHCSHRGTSLEFGTVERRGLRCCYHGWLFAADGQVLETPGEPPGSTYKDRVCHGAYPTLEYQGLVFAYLGPPEAMPDFPIYDTFGMPGYRDQAIGPREERYLIPCNWVQVLDNTMDAVHTVFLHGLEEARAALDRYRPSVDGDRTLADYVGAGLSPWEEAVRAAQEDFQCRVVEWQRTPLGMAYIHTRRVGDAVWVRIAEIGPPNFHQFPPTGDAFQHHVLTDLPVDADGEDATGPRVMHRAAMSRWVVPVDDTHTAVYALLHIAEGGERMRSGRAGTRNSESIDRTYAERQRQPGDFEAYESQRPIAVHALEHLGATDAGVILFRNLVREGIRAVQQGESPSQAPAGQPVRTYCQNTVIRVPPAETLEADRELLRRLGRQMAAGEHL
jgi:phenylpropionate dioxygenase-like ring-hydroxylating dioxygenase large terminal subunit